MAARASEKLEDLRKRILRPVLSPLSRQDYFDAVFDAPPIPNLASFLKDVPANLASGSIKAIISPPVPLSAKDRQKYANELDGSPTRLERTVWQDRLDTQQRRAVSQDESLQAFVERFVKAKEQQSEISEVTVGRVYALKLHLLHFQDWLGKDTAVREIDATVLLDYHASLLEKVKAKSWSRTTANHYMTTVKSFVRWLWQIEAITTLPRVLDGKSKALIIKKDTPKVITFTKEEIKLLMKGASDRTKLYILLMLNCGMTQKDISDLTVTDVNWEMGRVIRKRSKTSKHENVPTVNYLMWPETFRLLKQESFSQSESKVLVNSNGSALCTEILGADGKYTKTDNIINAFDRLRNKLEIKKPLTSFKKTSASLLRNNAQFSGLESLFLGHAPQSMSDKHYTEIPQLLFDQAIEWLGACYEIKLSVESDN